MTSNGPGDELSEPRGNHRASQCGPFILRPLLDQLPLSADGAESDIKINCIDLWGIWPCCLARRGATPPLLTLTAPRWQLICWHLSLRDTPLRSDPTRNV